MRTAAQCILISNDQASPKGSTRPPSEISATVEAAGTLGTSVSCSLLTRAVAGGVGRGFAEEAWAAVCL